MPGIFAMEILLTCGSCAQCEVEDDPPEYVSWCDNVIGACVADFVALGL